MKEDWYMDECLAFFLLGRLEAMEDALSKRPVEDTYEILRLYAKEEVHCVHISPWQSRRFYLLDDSSIVVNRRDDGAMRFYGRDKHGRYK